MNVYTSLDKYNSPHKSIKILPFNKLNESLKEWVYEKSYMLLDNMTESEKQFECILQEYNIEYYKQVFFKIDDSCYFLDFFLPRSNIAIEIDGSIHKHQKNYDTNRDFMFRKIGIKTIRIKNRDIDKFDISCIIKYKKKYTKPSYIYNYTHDIKYDNIVDLSTWIPIETKPIINGKYIVLYIKNNKLCMGYAIFNNNQWEKIDNKYNQNTIQYYQKTKRKHKL